MHGLTTKLSCGRPAKRVARQLQRLVRRTHDSALSNNQWYKKMGKPPQSTTSGIQAQCQLDDTGKAITPAAAMIPPTIGATDDASSFRITVNQKIMALNAMNTPPTISSALEKMS